MGTYRDSVCELLADALGLCPTLRCKQDQLLAYVYLGALPTAHGVGLQGNVPKLCSSLKLLPVGCDMFQQSTEASLR